MSELIRPFDLFENFDRLYGDWMGRNTGLERPAFPPVDIRTNNGDFIIELEVPGYERDQVDVSVQDRVLTITGRREEKKESEEEGYVRRERRTGSFQRRFALPENAASGDITASVDNGVLTLHVPRAKEPETTKIDVN